MENLTLAQLLTYSFVVAMSLIVLVSLITSLLDRIKDRKKPYVKTQRNKYKMTEKEIG